MELFVFAGTNYAGFFFVLIVVVIGLLAIYAYDRVRSQVKNVFKQIPYTELSKVADGEYVKIKGTVWEGGKKLIAPLSGRPCAYYHIEVKHLVGSGRSRHWETLFEKEVMGDLILKSGNYFAVIKGESLIAHLIFDRHYKTGFWNSSKENVEKFMKQNGHEMKDWFGFEAELELKEGVLRRGEEFAVTGRGNWIPASELDFVIPAKQVFLITETKEDRVFLSEDPSLVKPELFKPE